MDKDKAADKTHDAPAPAKPTKQEMAAELLDSYAHNMEHAAPRTLGELKLIQELAAAK
jgi:hypothetical protein